MSTIITVAGSGVAPAVDLTFPYLDQAYIKASVGGAARAFTWVNPTRIQMTLAVAGGTTLTVYRETPITPDLVVFNDGAVLTAAELNLADNLLRHRLEETDSRLGPVAAAPTTAEEIVDAAAAALALGTHTNVTVTYNDSAGSISLATPSATAPTTAEEIIDAVAASLALGSHTNVTVTYNDPAGSISLDASAVGAPSDIAYAASWNGVTTIAPSKNAVYDKIEALSLAAGGVPSDDVYAAGWNGVVAIAPSKNAVYDKLELMVAAIDGKQASGSYAAASHNHAWSAITSGLPSTLGGYGISDGLTTAYVPTFSSLSGKPTTRSGYGITDAAPRLPDIQSVISSATVTPTFADDQVNITAQAVALTLVNPTGTAADGWGIVVRLKDNGVARAITYGSNYRAMGITLPTTTVASKTLYIAMVYNAADTKWDVGATWQEA